MIALLLVLFLSSPEQLIQETAEANAPKLVYDTSHNNIDHLVGPGLCGAVAERLAIGPNMNRIEQEWAASPRHAAIPGLYDWDYRYTAIYTHTDGNLHVVDIWCQYWDAPAPTPDVQLAPAHQLTQVPAPPVPRAPRPSGLFPI